MQKVLLLLFDVDGVAGLVWLRNWEEPLLARELKSGPRSRGKKLLMLFVSAPEVSLLPLQLPIDFRLMKSIFGNKPGTTKIHLTKSICGQICFCRFPDFFFEFRKLFVFFINQLLLLLLLPTFGNLNLCSLKGAAEMSFSNNSFFFPPSKKSFEIRLFRGFH